MSLISLALAAGVVATLVALIAVTVYLTVRLVLEVLRDEDIREIREAEQAARRRAAMLNGGR